MLTPANYRQSACAGLQSKWSDSFLLSPDFWVSAQADAMFPLLWSCLSDTQKESVGKFISHPMSERIFAADALRMRNTTKRVLQAFKAANIPVIVMRGLAVSETYYPNSYLRPHTDIDILFEEKHTLMAKQVAGNILQFKPTNAYPLLFKLGDVPLDMHIEPLGIERIQAWKYLTPIRTDDFFKHAEKGTLAGHDALLVHPKVLLPYLCFHALKHSFERLIWLYDIALVAKEIEKNKQWEQVLAGIREYKLEHPCFYALSYVKEHMGAPIPDSLLEGVRPNMGFIERRLFARHMKHEIIPYLAERLFSRMLPSFSHRFEFWRETIYPNIEVREQIAGGGCVKCNFIRTRLKQIAKAAWAFTKEIFFIARA